MPSYHLDHLQHLETEAIHILREVAGEFERPALLFSGGKDSICLLRLAEKAFRPSELPLPLLNVDTGHHFPELNEFRDRRAAELGTRLIVRTVEDAIARGIAHPGDFRKQQGCDAVFVHQSGGPPRLLTADQQAIFQLLAENVVEASINHAAIRTSSRQVTLRKKGHHGQGSDARVSRAVRFFERPGQLRSSQRGRCDRINLLRQILKATIDGSVQTRLIGFLNLICILSVECTARKDNTAECLKQRRQKSMLHCSFSCSLSGAPLPDPAAALVFCASMRDNCSK